MTFLFDFHYNCTNIKYYNHHPLVQVHYTVVTAPILYWRTFYNFIYCIHINQNILFYALLNLNQKNKKYWKFTLPDYNEKYFPPSALSNIYNPFHLHGCDINFKEHLDVTVCTFLNFDTKSLVSPHLMRIQCNARNIIPWREIDYCISRVFLCPIQKRITVQHNHTVLHLYQIFYKHTDILIITWYIFHIISTSVLGHFISDLKPDSSQVDIKWPPIW